MYHIAIVEDQKEYYEQLQAYMKQYGEEHGFSFRVSIFHDGSDILVDYKFDYDLILLDIEMPKLNGMKAAEKIREMDERVELMFITNMAQYAIHGYSVGALDFVMKPINYYTFSMKISRAMKRVQKKQQKPIFLALSSGAVKLEAKQIYYVEIQNRMLHYHTEIGEYVLRGTLQRAEELLKEYPFAKCNHWYIVNLMHVKEVQKNMVFVGPFELEVSRRNKTTFLKALTEYMGGNM